MPCLNIWYITCIYRLLQMTQSSRTRFQERTKEGLLRNDQHVIHSTSTTNCDAQDRVTLHWQRRWIDGSLSLFLRLPSFGETFPIGNPITIIQTANICPLHVMSRQEVLPSRNSSSLRIRTSFLAGGREGELAKKLVLILNMLLFLPGNTSSLLPTYV